MDNHQPSLRELFEENRHVITGAVIFFIGFLAYLKSFSAGFQFDDYKTIVENPFIKHFDLPLLWSQYRIRFLTNLTFVLNYLVGGLNVFGWHLVNNLIHFANSFLAYLLVWITFQTPKLKGKFDVNSQYLISLFTALLFLVHPIQTQAVTYIVQRATSLCAFFYLSVLYFYVRARLANHTKDYFWMMALAFLGIFTKPVIITLPLMIIIYSLFFLEKKERLSLSRSFLFLFLFTLIIFVPFVLLGKTRLLDVASTSFHGVSSARYFLTQINVIVTYLQLWIMPVNQNLDYDYHLATKLLEYPTLLSFAAITCFLVLGFLFFRKDRLLAFGIFWFFIALGPQSSIFVLQDVIYEHRVYISSFGLSLLTSLGVFYITRNRKAYLKVAGLVIGVLALITFGRNALWSDPVRFMEDVVAKSPNKARPHNNLGFFYLQKGMLIEAEREYKKAITLDPKYVISYHNLAMTYFEQGRLEEAENIYRQLIQYYPRYLEPYIGLATVKQKNGDLDQSAALLNAVVEKSAYYSSAYIGLGNLYLIQRSLQKARKALERAVWLNPDSTLAYYNLGNVNFKEGNFYDALVNYQKAVALNPGFTEAFNNTGNIYFYFGDYANAVEQYQSAVACNPKLAEGYFNLANTYHAMGYLAEAQQSITTALTLYKEQGRQDMVGKIEAILFADRR